jgi:hypothetical protein
VILIGVSQCHGSPARHGDPPGNTPIRTNYAGSVRNRTIDTSDTSS